MKSGVWSNYFFDLSPEEMVETFSSKGWYESELATEHASALLERGNPEIIGKQLKTLPMNTDSVSLRVICGFNAI
jgi:sugar phosphate isomerase/epimerase